MHQIPVIASRAGCDYLPVEPPFSISKSIPSRIADPKGRVVEVPPKKRFQS